MKLVKAHITAKNGYIEGGKVYVTNRYSLFSGVVGNRVINNRHVTNLTRSIAKHNMLEVRPIIVTKELKIIDGQHRLEAAKNNDVPIYFIIASEDLSLDDVHLLNQDQRSWLTLDYVKSYDELGKKEYQIFYQFIKDYNISVEGGLIFIFNNNSGNYYHMVKSGNLELTNEDLKNGIRRADLWVKVSAYFLNTSSKRVYIYRSINEIDRLELGEKLIEKLNYSNFKLEGKTSLREYMRQFEDVLNWKNRAEPVRLF